MIGYCIWFYDINNKCYTTGCCNQEISEHNYIGKYCTCCGKKIIVPIVQHSYDYKPKGELSYAN